MALTLDRSCAAARLRPRTPRRSSAATRRRARRCCRCCTWCRPSEGYVSADGIAFCAEQLGLTEAEVTAVATFYTMYKRQPVGDYHVGVCTNTLCAVMGGDAIFADLQEHLGVGNDETTAGRQGQPGARGVQRGLRLRPGGDGELGVLRQHDPAVGAGPGRRPALGRPRSAPTRGAPRLCTWSRPPDPGRLPRRPGGRAATPRGDAEPGRPARWPRSRLSPDRPRRRPTARADGRRGAAGSPPGTVEAAVTTS